MVGPIIPGLNDNEVPSILKRSSEAGATFVAHTILRLPHAVAPIFTSWLEDHYPEKANRVITRVKMIRGGRLNDPRWGTRMTGTGGYADYMHKLVDAITKRYGMDKPRPALRTDLFRRANTPSLFDL
jgi:DNA repair photolyase